MKADTIRRVKYAHGYIELGALGEAEKELDSVDLEDRLLPGVMLARVELHITAKNWERLYTSARELTRSAPQLERGWFTAAVALREMNRIVEAKNFLQEAWFTHGHKSALLLFNLACYHALLGHNVEAKDCLCDAFELDESLRKVAMNDPDLEPVRCDIPWL